MWAIGDTITFRATFRDRDGLPATGLTVTTVASFAYDRAGTAITFPTLSAWSEIGSTGSYRATAVPVTAGVYTVIAGAGAPYLDYECVEDVVTAAQADPAGTELGTVTPDTLAYYIKALYARPVRSGNG